MSDHLMRAALEAAERGWYVFPLRPGVKFPALHGERTCPGTGPCESEHRKWEQRATTDPDRIRATWSTGPFNVGIATGPSGLLVVDLDTLKPEDLKGTPDGATSFAALCERAREASPDTYRVRTARGGEHLYFTQPPGVRLNSTKGRLAKKIDTRVFSTGCSGPGGTVCGGPTFGPCG